VIASTDWVLVARDPALLEKEPLADNALEIDSDPSRRVWTDDFNNLFKALKGMVPNANKTAQQALCEKLEPGDQAACLEKKKGAQ
jgi:hypothetical protein